MFETSVVRVKAAAAERRAGLLSASIAFHTFAAAAIVVAGLHSVSFPTNMPAARDLWRPAALPPIPPPLGHPDGGGPKLQQPKPPEPRPAQPAQATAPTVVPDHVTPLPLQSTVPSTDATPLTGSEVGPGLVPGPVGSPDGVDKSIGDVPLSPNTAGPALYRPDGLEVKAPVVIHRVSPAYPRVAIAAKRGGFAIVECIIDTNGQIRDAQVLRSSFAAFNQPALDAVRQWRFLPGTLRGKPVDTIFDLTVTFTIQ